MAEGTRTVGTDMGGLIDVEFIGPDRKGTRLRIVQTYDYDREKPKEISLSMAERKELAEILYPRED